MEKSFITSYAEADFSFREQIQRNLMNGCNLIRKNRIKNIMRFEKKRKKSFEIFLLAFFEGFKTPRKFFVVEIVTWKPKKKFLLKI